MKRLAVGLTAVLFACATPPDPGEPLYRQGDLRGALEAWRALGDDAPADRIAAVEAEIAERADGTIASARASEAEGRLAESILDYRLALELRPEDADTLAHVQELARELVSKRAALLASYREVRARGDLKAARDALAKLRLLDPFEPSYEIEEQRLRAAIAEEERRRRARIRVRQAERVEALIERGRIAFGEERLEDALELWRRALLIDPENERVQAYIARAEQQLESLARLRAEPEATP